MGCQQKIMILTVTLLTNSRKIELSFCQVKIPFLQTNYSITVTKIGKMNFTDKKDTQTLTSCTSVESHNSIIHF